MKLYIDMDGVLTDFNKGYDLKCDITYAEGSRKESRGDVKGFWDPIDRVGQSFWSDMPWMSDGKQLWNAVKNHNPIILSAVSKALGCRSGKKIWIHRELGGVKHLLVKRSEKVKYADSDSILVDDLQKNIDEWKAAGGIGIHHTSAAETIKKLRRWI